MEKNNKDSAFKQFGEFVIIFTCFISIFIFMAILIFLIYILIADIVKNFIPILTPIINQENILFLIFLLLFSFIYYIHGAGEVIDGLYWKKEKKQLKVKFIISILFLLSSLFLPFFMSFFYLKNIFPTFEQFFITGNPNWIVYLTFYFFSAVILSINSSILREYATEKIVNKIINIVNDFFLINFGAILLCCPLIIHYFLSKEMPFFSPLCVNFSNGATNCFSIISLFFIYLIFFIPLYLLFSLTNEYIFPSIIGIFTKKRYFKKEEIEKELIVVLKKTIEKSKHNPDILKDSDLFKSELRKISKQSKLDDFLNKKINSNESYGEHIDCIDNEILNLYFDSDENINYRIDLIRSIFEGNRKESEDFIDDYFIDHIMDTFYQVLELDKINNPTINYKNVKLNNKVFEKLYKIGLIKISDKFAIDYIKIPKIFKFENKYYKITKIGKKFFKDCTNLKQVIIPESVRKIDNYAFKNCENLKKIFFPKKLTEIGVGAFENCFSLFYETSYITRENTFYFPAKIGKYAFKNCKSIKSLYFAKEINKIEKGTFENCYSLQNIDFEDNSFTQKIDDYAFKNCKLLRLYSSQFKKVEYIGKKAFYGCKSLEAIEFKHILLIGDKAFAHCSSLKELHISSEVEKIGDYAFKNCKSLNKIIILNKIKDIGISPFQYFDNLVYGGNFDTNIFGTKNNIKEINVKLNSYLLEKLYKQEPFRFKFSDKNINRPFNEIKQKIISIEVPESFTYDGIKYNIKEIEDFGLRAVKSLQTVLLPNTITEITDYAFAYCESLTDIVIPDSVTKLGNGVFDHCEHLTNVTLSNNLIEIDTHCFCNCNSLVEIVIPNSVKNIGVGLFCNCINLEKIKLPKNITKIPDSTFYKCYSLKSIDIPNTVTEIGGDAFAEKDFLLGDPFVLLNYYSLHDKNRTITIPDSVIEIGHKAFNGVERIYYNGKAKGAPWGANHLKKKWKILG